MTKILRELESILNEVYPKFGIELRNSNLAVVDKTDMHTGSIDYTLKPSIFNRNETKYIDGITFGVPRELSENPELTRAYFAHECSHIELLKNPYHVSYFIALEIAKRLTKPIQETIDGKRKLPTTKLSIIGLLINYSVRLAMFVPFAFYGNLIERIVDSDAKSKGYTTEINTLRKRYPLKIFK